MQAPIVHLTQNRYQKKIKAERERKSESVSLPKGMANE